MVLLYAVCVVLRLARYNAQQDDGTLPAYAKEYFVGMPAPAGAISMIGTIGLKLQFGDGWWSSIWFLAFWIAGTSLLMVSAIPMKKFHALAVPPNWAAPLLAVLAIVRGGLGAGALHPDLGDHHRLRVPHAVRAAQQALAGQAPRGVGRQHQATARRPARDPPGRSRNRRSMARLGLRKPGGRLAVTRPQTELAVSSPSPPG